MAIFGQLTLLRALDSGDLERLVAWRNDPEVTGLLGGWSWPVSLEQEVDWFTDARKDPRNKRLAIERRDTGAYIGNIGLYDLDWKNRNAEYAILIGDRPSWGQGFGLDATHALLGFAFGELGLHRIYLKVLAHHDRAIRLYQKAGFQEEGRLRDALFRDGAFRDVLLMSIIRDEFDAP